MYSEDPEHTVCFPRDSSENNQILIDMLLLATLGARLFLPSPLSRSLAWPIHVGDDFPDSIAALLRGWDTNLLIARELDQPSTRGLLEYQDTTFGRANARFVYPSSLALGPDILLYLLNRLGKRIELS
jgi:hypothetical protein